MSKSVRRKTHQKVAETDRDRLIAIIEDRYPDAEEWLTELSKWPNVDLCQSLGRAAKANGELGEADSRSEESHTIEADAIKKAADYTFKLQQEGSIEKAYNEIFEINGTNSKYERYFSKKDYDADFAHWIKCDYVKSDEAAALCLGKDPRRVNRKTVSRLPKNSSFRILFENTFERIDRAQSAGALGKDGYISIEQLGKWVKANDIHTYSAFADALFRGVTNNAPRVDVREVHTLYKMLLSLLWDGFDYDPRSGNKVPLKEILPKLKKSAIFSVDEKTWNKHIEAAVSFAIGKGTIKKKVSGVANLSPNEDPGR